MDVAAVITLSTFAISRVLVLSYTLAEVAGSSIDAY
jgi:hypothetical protein